MKEYLKAFHENNFLWMGLGNKNCERALGFGWNRDHSARGNEVLSPV